MKVETTYSVGDWVYALVCRSHDDGSSIVREWLVAHGTIVCIDATVGATGTRVTYMVRRGRLECRADEDTVFPDVALAVAEADRRNGGVTCQS